MKFYKYHAIGNDYIIIDPNDVKQLTPEKIIQICHRNYGIGSDGILFGPFYNPVSDFSVKIYNPDGSEAEKSGNGLRIFSRYLYDRNLVNNKPFTIHTEGGIVESRILDDGYIVTVDMGIVSFESTLIPVIGASREVINETMEIDGQLLTYCAASIGNPHCVVLCDEVKEEEVRKLGPIIEVDERFPNRINVQFMKIVDEFNIIIKIWERGAGYTLASGSSSSAAAAVAYKLGLCRSKIAVHMPGGTIDIEISEDFSIIMSGPVTKVAEGMISEDIFK
ncbi:MAG: diaminopimelate epimerase [Spirochaetota bacterium]|nr:diaminopimelate epimerase [Spirochaetota bacterium]